MLLPHLEQNTLYKAFNQSLPVDDPSNAAARETTLNFMLCPSDPFNQNPYERALAAGTAAGHNYRAGELCGKLRSAAGLLPVAAGLHQWQ